MKLTSPDDQDWFYDFMLVKIEKQFRVTQTKRIDYGCQLILSGGAVVNLYYTLRYTIGGRNSGKRLYKLVADSRNDFLRVHNREKATEAILNKEKLRN